MLSQRSFLRIVLLISALALWCITPVLAQEHPAEHPKEHPQEMAPDVVKVAPNQCKVLLENDRVRVVEIWIKPGEKLAMHSHPAAVTYFLTAVKAKTTSPDGKTTETEAKAGEARWSEALSHAQENLGKAEVRALVIEMKEPQKK